MMPTAANTAENYFLAVVYLRLKAFHTSTQKQSSCALSDWVVNSLAFRLSVQSQTPGPDQIIRIYGHTINSCIFFHRNSTGLGLEAAKISFKFTQYVFWLIILINALACGNILACVNILATTTVLDITNGLVTIKVLVTTNYYY